jgi:hypothetical protein
MSVNAEKIIKTFDKLPAAEQKEVATEILRRTVMIHLPPMSDDELVFNAEEIFLELDRREDEDAKS